MEPLIIVAIIVGFYMAWNIGANDVANSMACAVGSKALPVFWAVILAGICEFLGAVLVGSHVTNTIRKGIIDVQYFAADPQVLAHGMICALLASALWLNLASYLGMPVSTTHSIVGALFGFGLLQAGFAIVEWGTMGQIVFSWFISPIVGGVLGFLIFKLISHYIFSVENPVKAARKGVPVCTFFTFFILSMATIYKGLKNLHLDLPGPQALGVSVLIGLTAAGVSALLLRRNRGSETQLSSGEQITQVEKIFVSLVIISSCTVAFAHGANDVANAIGPMAAVLEIVKTNAVPEQVEVEFWILALGGGGIVVGLAMFGYRVMKKVGTEVTVITPSRGVSADLAAMVTVLVCSRMGLPISTTHTLVGAIIGVGLARGITAINRKLVKSIFTSWLITVPIVAVLTVFLYLVGKFAFWS
ncbi:MAG: inorganic phosphate transporter [Planctomycetes bacterium]|nr:inorganic phosphate transporter [Planctomycetota bacterium]